MVKCLKQYFGNRIQYCEFYNHCFRSPCRDPKNNLQKNHDLYSRLKPSSDFVYLVQFRHPVASISSWFDLNIDKPTLLDRISTWDCRLGWRYFFALQVAYWQRFIKKWVLNEGQKGELDSNRILVNYADLTSDPRRELARVFTSLWPQEPLNRHKLDRVLKSQRIEERHDVREFRYWDTEWVRGVEDRLETIFEKIGVRRFTERQECSKKKNDGIND